MVQSRGTHLLHVYAHWTIPLKGHSNHQKFSLNEARLLLWLLCTSGVLYRHTLHSLTEVERGERAFSVGRHETPEVQRSRSSGGPRSGVQLFSRFTPDWPRFRINCPRLEYPFILYVSILFIYLCFWKKTLQLHKGCHPSVPHSRYRQFCHSAVNRLVVENPHDLSWQPYGFNWGC